MTQEQPQAVVLDVETNSLDNPEVIELSFVEFFLAERPEEPLCFGKRYRPERSIEPAAAATHLIFPDDLKDCKPSSQARQDLLASVPRLEYVAGHGIDFDANALGLPDRYLRIDTLALSRMTWPASSHKLAALYLQLEGYTDAARSTVGRQHQSGADVEMTVVLLNHILRQHPIFSLHELYMLSEKARIPTVMPFGKHKGTPIQDVPADYKAWLLRQPDIDPYLRKALEQ